MKETCPVDIGNSTNIKYTTWASKCHVKRKQVDAISDVARKMLTLNTTLCPEEKQQS